MRLGMQIIIEDYVHDKGWKIAAVIANNFYAVDRRGGLPLRDPEDQPRPDPRLGSYRSMAQRQRTALLPPSTARPIRSSTTPSTWSWSAPAARGFAPRSAARRRACARPASPRSFRRARTRSRRRAASRPRSATWATTTGAGTCTTPSRGRTGSATRTPSSICAATRRRRSTSSSIGACRSRAPRRARSTSGRSAA